VFRIDAAARYDCRSTQEAGLSKRDASRDGCVALGRPDTVSRRATVAAVGVAAAAALVSIAIAWKTLDFFPHVSDELAYDFQARIFASGHLALIPPEPARAFDLQQVIAKGGRWLSMYPPGWPLLLVPGVWLGVPWLVSPAILFLSVLGVFTLAREMFDNATAIAAAILFATSPFVLLNGAGRMSHLPTLCLSLWCAVFLVRGARTASGPTLVLAGALGGAAWLVRQLSATALLVPFVAWCIARLRAKRAWAGGVARLASGAAPFAVLMLGFDWIVFGDPFRTGYAVKDPTLRFNGDNGTYLPYAELLARNLPRYFADLNRRLWGFPWPDLLPLVPLLRPAVGRGKDLLLGAGALALVLVYSCYWYYDIVYSGPRLAFEAVGFLAILAARGILEAGGWLDGLAASLPRPARIGVTALLAAAAAAAPLALRLPAELRYHASCYHGHTAEALRGVDAAGVGREALVLVSGPDFAYGSFFPGNALDPTQGARVFVRDVAALRDDIVRRYSRRELWQVHVDLEPLRGPNRYADAFHVRGIVWHRVSPPR